MNRKSAPIPEPIVQLQRQLEQFRSTQSGRTKLPEGMHSAGLVVSSRAWSCRLPAYDESWLAEKDRLRPWL